jgi:hypothetical protein
MKRILVSLLFALTLLGSKSITVKADYFSGGFTSASNLNYVCHESISSTDCYYYVRSMADLWNEESNNVNLTFNSAGRTPYGCYAQPIVIKFTTHSDSTIMGEMFPYKSFACYSATPAETNDTWVKVFVNIYDENIEYWTDQLNYNSTSSLKSTIIHELGHVLSVAHPTNGSTNAVMAQGLQELYVLQNYDIENLVYKWGN